MLARVLSAAVNGIEAYPVEVEVNAGWGDPIVIVVGLPDVAVKESRDRVSTALNNSSRLRRGLRLRSAAELGNDKSSLNSA